MPIIVKIDDVLTINEAFQFTSGLRNGWVLPPDEPNTLNLYIYYYGKSYSKLDKYLQLEREIQGSINNSQINQDDDVEYAPEYTGHFYMYFTTRRTCGELIIHRPVQIIDKIGNRVGLFIFALYATKIQIKFKRKQRV
jgi:hypothetical protein